MANKIQHVIINLDNIDNTMEDKKTKNEKIILKKDKGIIEHTINSKIILTEDNKQLLND